MTAKAQRRSKAKVKRAHSKRERKCGCGYVDRILAANQEKRQELCKLGKQCRCTDNKTFWFCENSRTDRISLVGDTHIGYLDKNTELLYGALRRGDGAVILISGGDYIQGSLHPPSEYARLGLGDIVPTRQDLLEAYGDDIYVGNRK